jgi:opacity protein-like surface antigen
MKKTILGSLLSSLFLFSLCSFTYSQSFPANSSQTPSTSMERNWQFTASYYLGGASTASTDLFIAQPALGNDIRFRQVDLKGRSFDGPLYYGIRAGFFPRRKFPIGVEVEFTHLKVYADARQPVLATGTYQGQSLNRQINLGEIVQAYSVSHGVNLLFVNAVARQGFGKSKDNRRDSLIIAARVGAGPTLPHTESTVDGQHQEQYESGALGLQLAAGAELHLWQGLYLLGEYKFTRTRQKGKIFMGTAEALLKTQHGVVGLSYHF